MSDITFFPVGNADTCLLTTDNGRQLLFDFAAPKNQGDDDKRIDLEKELKDRLGAAGRDYYDVVSFSHLDKDHFAGASEFFYLEHAKKYQGEGRIHINEMWVPAATILESRNDVSTEGRIIQAEARYRLKNADGIRVISEPVALDDWLSKNAEDPDKSRKLITSAGKTMPGFSLGKDSVEIFVHSPFSYQRDEDSSVDRNDESSVFHLTIKDGSKEVKVLITGDVGHGVISDIVNVTEKHDNQSRLEWDLIKVPHHCSYHSLADDKGDEETVPTEDVKRLYEEYGRDGAIIVSPSKVIPETDETLPPHKQAAKYYRKVADEKNGTFRVTMEHPSEEAPKPLRVDVRGLGRGATVAAASSSSARGKRRLTQEPARRAG